MESLEKSGRSHKIVDVDELAAEGVENDDVVRPSFVIYHMPSVMRYR